MQTFDPAGSIAQESFRLFGIFLRCSVFLAAVAVCHRGPRTFFLSRGGKSNRWRNSFSATNFAALVLLFLLRGPAEKLLTGLGNLL
ncbi:MAG: hypothetical protein WA869_18690, partial [Alloacidobacterium sp.]